MSIIKEFDGNYVPLNFTTKDLQENSQLLSLPREILQIVVSESLAKMRPREAASHLVVFGRVSVLAYQMTQIKQFSEIFHHGKFLRAASVLALWMKNGRKSDFPLEAETLYRVFKRLLPSDLSHEEFIDRTFSALQFLDSRFHATLDKNGFLTKYSRSIALDLLSRIGWSPKELHPDSFMQAMEAAFYVFKERGTFSLAAKAVVYCAMHAEVLAHYNMEELEGLFQQHRARAHELCLTRIPDVYDPAQALEREVNLHFTEIERLQRDSKAAALAGDRERQLELMNQKEDHSIAMQNMIMPVPSGFQMRFRGRLPDLWDQLDADEEIRVARGNAALFRALSDPVQEDEEVELMQFYKRFFMRIL